MMRIRAAALLGGLLAAAISSSPATSPSQPPTARQQPPSSQDVVDGHARMIARLEEALALLPSLPVAARSAMQPTVDFWITVGYLHQAIRANCIERRQDAACVPGSGAAGVRATGGVDADRRAVTLHLAQSNVRL